MLVRRLCHDQSMRRSSAALEASDRTGSTRDPSHYDAVWKESYKRARRQGMDDSSARYIARVETIDQKHLDEGTRPYGSGDLELMY